MSALNKFMGIGNLGRDPEMRTSTSGDAITTISIGITETWKDKTTGQKKESTEWVRVVFYRKLAEIAGEYLKKGSLVYVEGKLQTRKWTDKAGIEKYTTEIVADTMQMLGSRSGGSKAADDETPQGTPRQNDIPETVDDIPF